MKSEYFTRLTAAQKRIAISKDVLSQIGRDKYNIRQGLWLDIHTEELDFETAIFDMNSEAVQQLLLGNFHHEGIKTPAPACTCCAIGAVCASAVRLFNKHNLNSANGIDDWDEAVTVLSEYFPAKQMTMIEVTFEQRDASHDDSLGSTILNTNEWGRILAFHSPGGVEMEAEDLAIKIFKNIIANQGTFKP